MIVVASDNAEVIARISTLLRQKGDLFTVASDEPQAFAAIRAERATLLIVDTSSSEFNGFALCGSIKNDPDLAGLPVLCLIGLADLSSLLSVLDCTADGFLTPPYDLSSLSSAIGDLQERQAGGFGQETVQTRFRVNHDGREFSVVSDRRQLLEFLLAAFESAIRMRQEQERIHAACDAEIRSISGRLSDLAAERDGTVAALHKELDERSRIITAAEEALKVKEQAESLLRTRFENVAQELKELGAALEKIRRSEEEKARTIAALESDGAAAAVERKLTEKGLTARVNALQAQLNEATLGQNSARSTVAALDVRIAEMERQLASATDELAKDKETIQSLNNELAQVTWARNTGDLNRKALEEMLEKTRSASRVREKEFKAALDDVTGNLNSIQGALEQNLRQLEQELAARKDLEAEVADLAKERDGLSNARDTIQNKLTLLQGEYEKAVTASATREKEFRAALDDVTGNLSSIQGALEQNLRQLERELAVRKDLELAITDLAKERNTLSADAESAQKDLADMRAKAAAEERARSGAEQECAALRSECERLKGQLDKTAHSLGEVRNENQALSAAKESERRAAAEIAGLKEQVAQLESERTASREAAQDKAKESAQLETERKSLQAQFEDARRSLDSASRDIGILNVSLGEERTKRKAAEDRLSASERECAEKDRIVRSLREELDATRTTPRPDGPAPASTDDTDVGAPPSFSGGSSDDSPPEKETSPQQDAAAGHEPAPPESSRQEEEVILQIPSPSATIPLPPSGPVFPLSVTEAPAVPAAVAGPVEGLPGVEPGVEKATIPENTIQETGPVPGAAGPVPDIPSRTADGELAISRDRWLDIIKWAHHANSLTPERRKGLIADLMRLSKLVQKGRHLTNRQDQEIRMLLARVQSLGYRFV